MSKSLWMRYSARETLGTGSLARNVILKTMQEKPQVISLWEDETESLITDAVLDAKKKWNPIRDFSLSTTEESVESLYAVRPRWSGEQ